MSKCTICGESYIQKVHNQKTCGKKCRKVLGQQLNLKHRNKQENKLKKQARSKEYYIKNAISINLKVNARKPYLQKCIECGKDFHTGRKIAHFCSNECNSNAMKLNRLGKDNP